MTLKEIAQEAGVSISTVSRVVNKNSPGAASKEVQDKIWEIVRRTGYTPNSTARRTGNCTAVPLHRLYVCENGRHRDRPVFHIPFPKHRTGGIQAELCVKIFLFRL